MQLRNHSCLLLLTLSISYNLAAQKTPFPIVTATSKVTIVYDKDAPKLDSICASLLALDIERVTNYKPEIVSNISNAKGNVIIIGAVQSALINKILGHTAFLKSLQGKWECFGFQTINRPTSNISKALVIAGSDARGTAFGVFTLSEKIGVSPWYWWADVAVRHQQELVIDQPDFVSSPPAVKFRGIFINDEDWGLQPWAAKTFEPETGDIGPKTYAKVFELLLRLKANLIWPAMHPSTQAFFHFPGNVKVAEEYQIVIGSSHAEPMLRNNVGEWDVKTMGPFNYFTNKEKISKYWEERVQESKGLNAVYSLGMRGVHDGQMEGIKDLKQAVPVIEKIIGEQRVLLSKYIKKDVTAIPQVLTPYKEVLEIYDNGLKVPDDITLVWPDDNYGYIARLNNEKEKARKGSAGVYYHASYWGRPHDYLWLPSTHPSLVREEMLKAYESGADRLWVLNVGDIKPQEYNIQQFLDLAYDPTPFKDSRYTKQHLLQWLTSLFGAAKAEQMQSILWEYYALAFQRRPEFMGWSQTEPETKTTYTDFNHFYFGDEAQKRIDRYNHLESEVKKMRRQLRPEDADAFYQLVYYPVVGASWMNKKFLYRDKSYFYGKQNRLSAYDFGQLSKAAYDSIVKETDYFNTTLTGGKWKHIMSMNPRNLVVYQPPVLPEITRDSSESWNVAPEGYVTKDSSLLQGNSALALPAFDNLNQQRFFVDVFLSKNQSLAWTTTASENWIHLSEHKGLLGPGDGMNQQRIWVDVNWNKLTKKNAKGFLTFEADKKRIVVNVEARKTAEAELAGYEGFIENDGFVSIEAANFNRATAKQNDRWQVISDLGYSGNALEAFPLAANGKSATDIKAIEERHALVEYDFYTFTQAAPTVHVLGLPTHPLNDNYKVRYAVAIDQGPLQVVDIKTVGRSDEWKQNVLRNRAERKISFPLLNAGKHRLKIYCIDPGVILDEIWIDLGGLKKAYGSIAETKIKRTE